MCLPYHPASSSPQSRSDAEVIGESKTAEEFPAHLSSSEESTGSWSQLANDEDNPDDTSSYLQLSERSLRYPPCLFPLHSVLCPPSLPCISSERQQLQIYSEYCKECLMADFISIFLIREKILPTFWFSARSFYYWWVARFRHRKNLLASLKCLSPTAKRPLDKWIAIVFLLIYLLLFA